MHLAQINRPQQLHELIIKGSGGLPPLEAELLRRAAAHHQARRRRDGGRKKGWVDGRCGDSTFSDGCGGWIYNDSLLRSVFISLHA